MRWGIAAEIPPHITFYDIDNHDISEQSMYYIQNNTNLVYKTGRGYHAFSYKYDPTIAAMSDNRCPHNAVRIYPDSDYQLIGMWGAHADKFLCWLVLIHGFDNGKVYQLTAYGYEPVLKPYVKPRMKLK